ncbi:MAG: DNA processing protein [Arenicella sp.]
MHKETPFYIALELIPGVGNVLAKHLVSYCGSAERVFTMPKGKLLKIPQIGEVLANSIRANQFLKEAEGEIEKALKNNIEILTFNDKAYPQRLRHVVDAPLVIYRKGETNFNTDKVVAIVGTREATPYGIDLTEQLVKNLSAHPDLMIISGLAYGIDICAHRKCVELGVPTVGVMANGLDLVYPSAHKNIAQKMLENGALISENRFGTKPDAPKFPKRNRIIAGMADVVILVEAKKKGGALITAELGNSYDREVCAFPGEVYSQTSEGCHNLIKRHKAHLITSAKDVDELMNWDLEESAQPKSNALRFQMEDENEQKVVDVLLKGNDQIDRISYKTQIPIGALASVLLSLEFAGLVKCMPGKMYGLNRG